MDTDSATFNFLCTRTLALFSIVLFCVACSNGESANDPTFGPDKPQIPKQDFEWNGVFKGSDVYQGTAADFDAPQVVEPLTIRGQWQGEHFNLYMEQGNRGATTWVENLIFNRKFYTITHEWHTNLPDGIKGKCFETVVYNNAEPTKPLPITVDSLNSILKSSRFVALEVIDGQPMNHFRATCLSASSVPSDTAETPSFERDGKTVYIPPFFPIKIFSDIYVPEGEIYAWTKWLQFGDGVGPDPQNDEWFLFEEWNEYPADIVLPTQCHEGSAEKQYVQQSVCENLVPPTSAG